VTIGKSHGLSLSGIRISSAIGTKNPKSISNGKADSVVYKNGIPAGVNCSSISTRATQQTVANVATRTTRAPTPHCQATKKRTAQLQANTRTAATKTPIPVATGKNAKAVNSTAAHKKITTQPAPTAAGKKNSSTVSLSNSTTATASTAISKDTAKVIEKDPLLLATASILHSENFTPGMLFNSSNFTNGSNVFDIAECIKNNADAFSGIENFKNNEKIILEMASFAITLRDDEFKPDYAEQFIGYRLEIRTKCNLNDLNGIIPETNEPTESANACMDAFTKICQEKIKSGFDARKFFESYFQSSFGEADGKELAFRSLITKARNIPDDEYAWFASDDIDPKVITEEQLKNLLTMHGITEKEAMVALAAFHALSMEMLKHMNIPGKTEDNSHIYISRAEEASIMDKYDITTASTPDETKKMMRTSLVCTCAGTFASQFGTACTLYKVPPHLVLGGYFVPGLGWTTNNTVMFIPHNVPFTLVGHYKEGLKRDHARSSNTEIDTILSPIFRVFRQYDDEGKLQCGSIQE
jgi:hypothetical protein